MPAPDARDREPFAVISIPGLGDEPLRQRLDEIAYPGHLAVLRDELDLRGQPQPLAAALSFLPLQVTFA
jgi:hypothetical protein